MQGVRSQARSKTAAAATTWGTGPSTAGGCDSSHPIGTAGRSGGHAEMGATGEQGIKDTEEGGRPAAPHQSQQHEQQPQNTHWTMAQHPAPDIHQEQPLHSTHGETLHPRQRPHPLPPEPR